MPEPIMLYRVADGGPFDIQVDNGVVIENITDDLVNAKILLPDHRLQAIADAYEQWVEADGDGKDEHSNLVYVLGQVVPPISNALTGEADDG